jgi:hypothetical protein
MDIKASLEFLKILISLNFNLCNMSKLLMMDYGMGEQETWFPAGSLLQTIQACSRVNPAPFQWIPGLLPEKQSGQSIVHNHSPSCSTDVKKV